MSLLSIDSKINELSKKLIPLNKELEEIEGEIEELEFQKSDIEDEITSIEDQIKKLKTNLLQERAIDLDKFTGDQFTNYFILASMFCARDDEQRPNFNSVYLTETEMMATDSFRGILIGGQKIPEALHNKVIKWDTRGDYETNALQPDVPFPKLKELITDISNRDAQLYNNVDAANFYKFFNVETYSKTEDREIVVLTFDKIKIAFNKHYLDITMLCFAGQTFNVNVKRHWEPMFLYNKNIKIIVLPIRVQL